MAAEAEGQEALLLPEGTDEPRAVSAGPGTLDIDLVISKLLAFKDSPEKQVRLIFKCYLTSGSDGHC